MEPKQPQGRPRMPGIPDTFENILKAVVMAPLDDSQEGAPDASSELRESDNLDGRQSGDSARPQ